MITHHLESARLYGLPMAVFDFETTGTDPASCHPVQVAVVHAKLRPDTEPVVVYRSLIRPPVPIPAESSEIHGITDEDVADAPTMEEAVDEIVALLHGRALCAYNLPFDRAILARFADGIPWGIDPLVAVREADRWVKGSGRHRLAAACERRGINLDGAHDAAADAMATARLAPVVLDQIGPREGWWHDRTIADLWRWQARTGARQEQDLADYLAKFGRQVERRWRALTDQLPTRAP